MPTARKRAAQRPANPVGRPAGRNSDQTRVNILDVAESMLADRGIDGTSIRDIAVRCNVQAAVIGYHFGSKAELFDAVVARRAVIVNKVRADRLAAEKAASKGRPLALEVLIDGYVGPLLHASCHGDAGWRNFASLMGRLTNSPRGTEMVNKHFSSVASSYMAEFRRTLPTVSEGRLVDAFLYMLSAMLLVCANTGRWEAMLEKPSKKPRDADAIMRDLNAFVAGGFRALLNDPT